MTKESKMQMDQLQQLRGAPVVDSTGEQIGKVEEVFYDVGGGQPEWIGLGTGFFSTKRVLVPVQGAEIQDDSVQVPYDKDHVKGAPDVDSDEIGHDTERELYAYYGLAGGAGAGGGDVPRGDTDQAVTRHEEELAVGKQEVETGRARVRKWVETEPVAMDVELRQETAHVTREPIDQPVADGELGEQEIEVPLRGERPVVQKQTVAKERVGIEKDVSTDTQTVEDEVRKEHVDVEGDR
jgi:uncharacterized protein (TIGR02271 family)